MGIIYLANDKLIYASIYNSQIMRNKAFKNAVLPVQGFLFDMPPVINRVRLGMPSTRAVQALKYIELCSRTGGNEGVTVETFGDFFYGKKGWVGLQLKIQSLAYLRILIKKGWVIFKQSEHHYFPSGNKVPGGYFLTTAGEHALKSVTQV